MNLEQIQQEIVPVAKKDLEAMIAYLVTRPWQEVAHLLRITPEQPEQTPEQPQEQPKEDAPTA